MKKSRANCKKNQKKFKKGDLKHGKHAQKQ